MNLNTTKLLLIIGFISMVCPNIHAQTVVNFDELSNYTHSSATGTGSYFDGHGADASLGSWDSQGVQFNTGQFGPGWSYSNVNDATTEGFTNQWAAITGTDVSGNGNYIIGNTFAPNGVFFNLAAGTEAQSLQVTNATYTALSFVNGAGPAKMFGGESGNDPDFFKLTFTGFAESDTGGTETGNVEFYLADYRFSDNALDYFVDSWQMVDLSSLGSARSIGIGFESSDNHPDFGLNTPAYVAIDNLIVAVPEPNSLTLTGLTVLAAYSRRRKR